MFHLEQALQLLLKYILAKEVGYFSKTHSPSVLGEEVRRIYPEIAEVFDRNRRYVRDEAEELLKFVKSVFEFYEGR